MMLFIGWAWHDSTRAATSLDGGGWSLTQAGSGLALASTPAKKPAAPQLKRQTIRQVPVWQKARFDYPEMIRTNPSERFSWTERYFVQESDDLQPRNSAALHFWLLGFSGHVGEWAIFIPHWCLLLVMATLWLALIAWSTRRRRLALQTQPQLQTRAT